MTLLESSLWVEDIDTELNCLPELESMEGKSILVTGATGLIGSALIDTVIRYNEEHSNKIQIIAAGRNKLNVEKRFGKFIHNPYFAFALFDALKSDNSIPYADYVVYGAGVTLPGLMVKNPVETILSNFLGFHQFLESGKESKKMRYLYLSSSEVYGVCQDNHPIQEEDWGRIDILSPRSSYAMGKRACEALCTAYAHEYGENIIMARPGHIFGPTATVNDSRVSSAFAYAAAEGRDIILKSDGSSLRSYCYCLDCAAAIIKILIHGKKGKAYNISSPGTTITIKQMAELLAQAGNVNVVFSKETSQTEARAFNPMDISALDSAKLQNLGWHACFDAQSGFSHTVEILRNMKQRYFDDIRRSK